MSEKMAVYAAMVDCMDQGIERIVSALKETKQLDNTLILFLSDNGGCDEYGIYGFGWANYAKTGKIAGPVQSNASYGACWANASNTPFRYYKHYIHEGGISTPLIMHWPARIKSAGQLRYQVGHLIDIMPTLLEISGGSYPAQYKGNKIIPMEGVSLCPAMENKSLPERAIFWEHHGNRGLRKGKWKLVAKGEFAPWELYDMEADRTELNDLAKDEPERVEKMAQMWLSWAKRANVLPMNPKKKKEKS
jgi:arylsulfatase A-like enzyme